MKNLPREVYIVTIAWFILAPSSTVFFFIRLRQADINHVPREAIANFGFIWPLAVAFGLTMLLMVELAAFSLYRDGFFSRWIAIVTNTSEKK